MIRASKWGVTACSTHQNPAFHTNYPTTTLLTSDKSEESELTVLAQYAVPRMALALRTRSSLLPDAPSGRSSSRSGAVGETPQEGSRCWTWCIGAFSVDSVLRSVFLDYLTWLKAFSRIQRNGCYGKWQRERSSPAHRSSLNIVGGHGLSRFLLLSRATMRFKSSTKADWASFASLSKRPPRLSRLVVI
jgi:hypothetical protein